MVSRQSRPAPDALIFDMDGFLLDTARDELMVDSGLKFVTVFSGAAPDEDDF